MNELGIHLTCVHVPYTEEEKSEDVVSEYVEEKNITAPIVLDQDYEIVAKYKIQGLPSFCLFDQDGQLIDRKMGDTGWERILKKLEKHSIGEERVLLKSNKELKRNVIFSAGVGAVLLILMMLKWLPISADWELALILFGLGILFYLKRVLRKEEESHKS